MGNGRILRQKPGDTKWKIYGEPLIFNHKMRRGGTITEGNVTRNLGGNYFIIYHNAVHEHFLGAHEETEGGIASPKLTPMGDEKSRFDFTGKDGYTYRIIHERKL